MIHKVWHCDISSLALHSKSLGYFGTLIARLAKQSSENSNAHAGTVKDARGSLAAQLKSLQRSAKASGLTFAIQVHLLPYPNKLESACSRCLLEQQKLGEH
jgi:hypothetical protein